MSQLNGSLPHTRANYGTRETLAAKKFYPTHSLRHRRRRLTGGDAASQLNPSAPAEIRLPSREARNDGCKGEGEEKEERRLEEEEKKKKSLKKKKKKKRRSSFCGELERVACRWGVGMWGVVG